MAISNEGLEIIKTGVKALSDKKAEDIKVIDISQISVIADALVIASGTNTKQITFHQPRHSLPVSAWC